MMISVMCEVWEQRQGIPITQNTNNDERDPIPTPEPRQNPEHGERERETNTERERETEAVAMFVFPWRFWEEKSVALVYNKSLPWKESVDLLSYPFTNSLQRFSQWILKILIIFNLNNICSNYKFKFWKILKIN